MNKCKCGGIISRRDGKCLCCGETEDSALEVVMYCVAGVALAWLLVAVSI